MSSTGLTVPWVASLIARLPDGALPFSLLLTVQQGSGSYTEAGAVVAALSLGFALVSPLQGRLLDRAGPRAVIPVAAAHFGSVAAIASGSPLAALLAFAAGATAPQMSALVRAALLRRVEGAEDQALVLGGEALVIETLFLVGPATVALALTALSPAVTTVAFGGLASGGSVWFAISAPASPKPTNAAGLHLRSRGLMTLVAATIAFGIADGIVQVAIPAVTTARLAGVLLTALGIGSVVGGMSYMRFKQREPARDFARGHAAMACVLAVTSLFVGSTASLVCAVIALGLAMSPIPITNSRLLAQVTEPHHATEAYAWLVVAVSLGGAIGSGAGGVLVDRRPGAAAFLVAAVVVAAGAVIATAGRAALRSRAS